MSLKRWFQKESIRLIKEAIGMDQQPEFEAKDIYLKKGEDVLGLHTYGDQAEHGFAQIEAWCNAYDAKFKYLGSIYRIFGPIEDEAESLKKDGWVVIEGPVQKCETCDEPAEARRYKFCYPCWYKQDPRNTNKGSA